MRNEIKVINTSQAPAAIGTYSQAVRVGEVVYLSGQIALTPEDNTRLVAPDLKNQLYQVFDNIKAVVESAGGSMKDIVKLTIYMIDLGDFDLVNEIMGKYFSEPYPARAVVEVSKLPKSALVEMDAILVLNSHWELGL